MKQYVLLIFCLVTLVASEGTTESSLFEETTEYSESKDNTRIQIQTRKVDLRQLGWTAWSEWSTCSRSCDGGVSHQLRRCTSQAGCKGEPVRYKICNMQSCPEAHDFRDAQCAAYDDIPYESGLFKWSAHYDDNEACALTCRGRPSTMDNLISQEGIQAEEEGIIVVARLADRVHDGTRCRPGSLDMCIEGKCRRVGCDLRVGSTKKVDSCGVCGGDGSSCAQPLYHWNTTPLSLCSVTCGGGYKMSRPVCQNRVSGAEVEEQLCNASQKPKATVVHCNMHKCPPKWSTGEWGPCSVSCGGGSRLRQVQCVEEVNSTRNKVNEHNCRGHKPRYQEPCNQMDCPRWHTSPWSGCSVSCGEGVQVRGVECRDSRDLPSVLCDTYTKPSTTQPCSTGITCPHEIVDDDHYDELLPGLYHTQPLVQPYPPIPAKAEKLIGEPILPSESTFVADEWGPCSVTCGEGIKRREVHCKIFLEFSRTIAKLPDKQCSGTKPVETERCVLDPCSMANRIDTVRDGYLDGSYPDLYKQSDRYDSAPQIRLQHPEGSTSYSWKEEGFSDCSASCLGGVQELIVNCIRDDNQRPIASYMCPPETKPEITVRTCNEHPCPPRWNYSNFQPCTKSCGIGIQTREVNCVSEVNQGGGSTVIIPNHMCPQPQPPDRQYCNVLDCPVKWHVSEWSKCSKSCGGGVKERKVECKQVMAQNHVVDRETKNCPSSKPLEVRPCNTKSCVLESDKPEIVASNGSYIQHDPKKKRISVKIGGSASVFHGTMIKIKCHVKRFNRTKILWKKDHVLLSKSKKYKISKKGALRIQNLAYRDSGIYSCIAGKSTADLSLTVKPKPGEFLSSEEIEKHASTSGSGRHGDASTRRDIDRIDHPSLVMIDDHSHEQRPGDKIKPLYNNKKETVKSKIAGTMPPSLSHGGGSGGGLTNVNRVNVFSTQLSTTTLVSDQEQDGTIQPQLPANSGSQIEVPSSASRPMPHFQKLLANLQQFWPFQTFSNSRGHRIISFPFDEIEATTTEKQYFSDDNDEMGQIVVLGKGTADNLIFDWLITEWSDCSQTCGGTGYQIRTAHCTVRLHNTTQDVAATLCEDAGIPTPTTIRKCGFGDCPRWVATEWTPCEESKCYNWDIALQTREIYCQIGNATDVDDSLCDENKRPTHRQECHNNKCKATWQVGEWSECEAECEKQGVKYRILQCVWYGTQKSAGSACKTQHRPTIIKTCKGLKCPKVNDCMDHSNFCPNVKAMNMCRIHRYQQQCCHSCTIRG